MNEPLHKDSQNGHGTTISYVVGFILSLIFTINAYILVVNKMLTGTTLLTTILVFAVSQMAVQVLFFLHLGRGPKPLYNVVFFISTIGIILVVVIGSTFIMNNLHYNMAPTEVTKKLAQDESIYQVGGEATGACQTIGKNYKVTLGYGKVSPAHTEAQLCDTLTFINEDDVTHNFSFGQETLKDNYAGQQVSAHKNYPKTITLNQSGTYTFQDPLDPAAAGDFTVAP